MQFTPKNTSLGHLPKPTCPRMYPVPGALGAGRAVVAAEVRRVIGRGVLSSRRLGPAALVALLAPAVRQPVLQHATRDGSEVGECDGGSLRRSARAARAPKKAGVGGGGSEYWM